MNRAKFWIEAVLANQRESGDFGPEVFKGAGNRDLWTNMPMLFCLQSYHEYSEDPRVLTLMSKYFAWQRTIPDEHFLRDYDRLLMGGIWAQIELRHQYDEEAKGKRSPFWIEGLKPIQLASFDLDEYRRCRNEFTTEEWVDLLIRSIGMEP